MSTKVSVPTSLLMCSFYFLSVVSAGSRTLSFKNSCNEEVRLGFTSGAIPSKTCVPDHGNPCPGVLCSSNSDCPQNGACNTNNNQCYYPSFLPSDKSVDLKPGATQSLLITINDGDLYSGALYVSTGCDASNENYQQSCETAICPPKIWPLLDGMLPKQCDLFTGPVGPHTRAEFTFAPSNVDFYDISLMSGANIPISMTPIGGKPDDTEKNSPYTCGSAGSVSAGPQGLSACSYGYNALVNGVDYSSDVAFVVAVDPQNPTFCNTNNICSDTTLTCGLQADRAGNSGNPLTTLTKVCGKLVGVWNADEICIWNAIFENVQKKHWNLVQIQIYLHVLVVILILAINLTL